MSRLATRDVEYFESKILLFAEGELMQTEEISVENRIEAMVEGSRMFTGEEMVSHQILDYDEDIDEYYLRSYSIPSLEWQDPIASERDHARWLLQRFFVRESMKQKNFLHSDKNAKVLNFLQ